MEELSEPAPHPDHTCLPARDHHPDQNDPDPKRCISLADFQLQLLTRAECVTYVMSRNAELATVEGDGPGSGGTVMSGKVHRQVYALLP